MAVESKGLLEICIDNYDDSLIAISGGADRLECCSRLDLDGLTPDIDMVRSIQTISDIPIRVMIRPRAGDFNYAPHEVLEMVSLIETFKELEVEGFVIGCLDVFDDIDESALELLSEACDDFAITFHRAFDLISNQESALEMLREQVASGAPDNVKLKEFKRKIRKTFEQSPPPGIPDIGLHICFDVYMPNATFSKLNPGLPDFVVAATFYNGSRVSFMDCQKILEQCKGIRLKIATVSDSGTVVMFGITNFGVPLFEKTQEAELKPK